MSKLALEYKIEKDKFINILKKQINSNSKHLVNEKLLDYYD